MIESHFSREFPRGETCRDFPKLPEARDLPRLPETSREAPETSRETFCETPRKLPEIHARITETSREPENSREILRIFFIKYDYILSFYTLK
jgi:hypothetical protein